MEILGMNVESIQYINFIQPFIINPIPNENSQISSMSLTLHACSVLSRQDKTWSLSKFNISIGFCLPKLGFVKQ